MIKKNKRLMLIATVLSQSVSELSMLIIVWSMCITVAGCTFYFLEADANPTIFSGMSHVICAPCNALFLIGDTATPPLASALARAASPTLHTKQKN